LYLEQTILTGGRWQASMSFSDRINGTASTVLVSRAEDNRIDLSSAAIFESAFSVWTEFTV
jgi:hypothetical protein